VEIAAYSDWFPRDSTYELRLKHIGNGNYKVQMRGKRWWSPVWITVTDTHPGHGGTIRYYSKKGAEMFFKEVRARLERE